MDICEESLISQFFMDNQWQFMASDLLAYDPSGSVFGLGGLVMNINPPRIFVCLSEVIARRIEIWFSPRFCNPRFMGSFDASFNGILC